MRSSYHTAGAFSGVGYYFGRYLRQVLKVPVGLINSSWGGTIVEAWTSKRMIDQEQDLIKIDPSIAGQIPHVPSCLYNAMISPVIPYGIRGAIWYQGESNAGNGYNYRFEHANMIKDWRENWKQGDFPFLSVQLAPFLSAGDPADPAECNWADTRESQLIVAKDVKNSGMAVITDVGDPVDIHPKNKQPVGERLAYIALNKTYGMKNVAWSGPDYKSMSIKGGQIVLKFNHADGGLVSKGGDLKGFTIAEADKKFVWADAKIVGNTVVVSSSAVAAPVAVRYGWRYYPIVNLYNGKDLPASPFRTDDWKLVTQP
ncbi:MAG: sialate O-acetylesterase [Armatimonadota bacterium]